MILTVNVSYDWGRSTTENFHFLEGLWDFLDDTDSKATLFVLGNVAEKLSQESVSSKVEIASFCMEETSIRGEDNVLEALKSSKAMLETMFKQPIKGFRIPDFNPDPKTWEIAKMLGYEYSSSLIQTLPFRRPKVLGSPFIRDGIVEFPVPSLIFPIGLHFLRFFPLAKFFKPYLFHYSTTELISLPPGDAIKSKWARFVLGFRRGKPARKLLYDFLFKHAPTSSIEQALKNIQKSNLNSWESFNPPKKKE